MGGLNGITKFYKQEDWGKPKEKISLKKLNFKEKKKQDLKWIILFLNRVLKQ